MLPFEIEPAEEPSRGEPADDPPPTTEVVFVKAVVRKLRMLAHPFYQDDLVCNWWGGPPTPDWDGEGYYVSKTAYVHKNEDGTEVTLPAGTYFVVALEEGKEIGGVAVGDYARIVCLDPSDPDKTLSFGYWHAVQEDLSHKFTKIDNEMVALAIAATGLAL
jgi:hypothetical protein